MTNMDRIRVCCRDTAGRRLAPLLRQLGQHTQCQTLWTGPPATAVGPAYPVCVHAWLARGCCAPLRTPGLSRRCRSTGRPGAQPPDPRANARKAQRRTAVVDADLTPAEQVAFDQAAEALRLPKAGERASEAVSGVRGPSPDLPRRHRGPRRLRTLRRPPGPAAGGAGSLPAGIHRAAGAGWERPPNRSGSASTTVRLGTVDPWIGGGSFPAPLCAPKAESGFASRRRTATAPTALVNHVGDRRVAEVVAEGGFDFRYSNRGPEGGPAEGNRSDRGGEQRGRLVRLRRGDGPSRWRRAGQRFEGAIRSVRCSLGCGSRSRILPPVALGRARCSRRCPL